MKLKAAEDSAKRLTKGKKARREKSAEVIVCGNEPAEMCEEKQEASRKQKD